MVGSAAEYGLWLGFWVVRAGGDASGTRVGFARSYVAGACAGVTGAGAASGAPTKTSANSRTDYDECLLLTGELDFCFGWAGGAEALCAGIVSERGGAASAV